MILSSATGDGDGHRWVGLFEQSARDPRVIGAVAAVLLAVATLASGVPAYRASRADPGTVLRSD